MLVLSRRCGESIVLPNLGVTVRVQRVNNRQVRLGIDAPPGIQVLREELLIDGAGAAVFDQPDIESLVPTLRSVLQAALAEADQLAQDEQGRLDESSWCRLITKLKAIDGELAAHAKSVAKARRTSRIRRALVVDDNCNESKLLASFLRMKDFRVETADNGEHAMRSLERHPLPDVVLLDMNMPQYDGRWTVDAIRQQSRYDAIKIFAVSGMHPGEYGVDVGRTGCDRWFRKPLNPQLLVDAISAAIPADKLLAN
ncbi:MAG: response regulator [Pirellulaceae bacterium]